MKFEIQYLQTNNLKQDDLYYFSEESLFGKREGEEGYVCFKSNFKNSDMLNESILEQNLIPGGSLVVPNWMNNMIHTQSSNNNTYTDLNAENENVNNTLDFKIKDRYDSGSCDLNSIFKRPRHFSCFICNKYKSRSTKARFKVCKHVCCYHCLRKALQIEYWGAKKDVWRKCRAVCPFCYVFIDWTKIKPFIILTSEAKEYPLMALCESDERMKEAYRVLNAFFPKGVPNEVIFGQNIDFTIKPKVTQTLFGYGIELSGARSNYSNSSLSGHENNDLIIYCGKIIKLDSDLESFEKETGLGDITTTEGEDDIKDGSDYSYYSDSENNTTKKYTIKGWDRITENDNSGVLDRFESNSEKEFNTDYSRVYPDIFSSWRNIEFISLKTNRTF
ncbi:hypothetical protein FG386_000084 [Cryptosporidium ryanae]|uniref:uncharacterized protein n=1 Tax=Cryptosporidium ryanae TaxID=515981 RepID=UPI00351A287E|nr:hypothetical protein FG386_000084 [Cryptosporidium ryanae]